MSKEINDIQDLRKLYESTVQVQQLNEDEVAKAEKYSKIQLVQKCLELTKLSEAFLKKQDEDALRTIYKTFMSMGKAKIDKDLKGGSSEE